jgi:GAF domain-containing protein
MKTLSPEIGLTSAENLLPWHRHLTDRMKQTARLQTLDSLYLNILDIAIAVTGADKGNIQLLNAKSGVLEIVSHRGYQAPFLKFFMQVKREQRSACGVALLRAERVIVPDISKSPIFKGYESERVLLQAGIRAVQSTPMFNHRKAVIGVINTHFNRPHTPPLNHLKLLDSLSSWASGLIQYNKGTTKTSPLKPGVISKLAG